MKTLRIFLYTLTLSLFVANSYAIDAGFEYQLIEPPVPTSTTEQVEVVEMFWYGCPHCFQFEPRLKKWIETKPANVKFIRIPAVFRPSWQLHAQVYYTAEALNLIDKIHEPFFDAIHKNRQRLDTRDSIKAFFAANGVNEAIFEKTFDSFIVMSKVQQAVRLSQAYGISGVPSMIVNGKFRTDAKTASINDARGPSHANMMRVTDLLIKQESEKLTAPKKQN